MSHCIKWCFYRHIQQQVKSGYLFSQIGTLLPMKIRFACLTNYITLTKLLTFLHFSSFQLLSRIRLFATPWITAHQACLSITNSQSPLKLMSFELMMPSNHLTLCRPLSSCLQSFLASGSFQMSQLFASGGQSIGASASTSVLPMNTQDWSPLGWTGWISLQSKGISRVFSNTTVQKHQFFCAQLYL